MGHQITILPQQLHMEAADGHNLLQLLRSAGLAPDAPCGGNGTCGKCKVWVNGQEVSACQTTIHDDMIVTLPVQTTLQILTEGLLPQVAALPLRNGHLIAIDLGTTTVAGYLLEETTGKLLARLSAPNPQSTFGADVICRIQCALKGQMEDLTQAARQCVETLCRQLCNRAGIAPSQVGIVSLVGNPAMQQLFLGIPPHNLAQIPFAPVLTQADAVCAAPYLPALEKALLLIIPNISGFVGADTLAAVLATGIQQTEALTLLVDIGTNGEMVLGNRHGLVACSTAAGPALEGANIHFGMGARDGAIDHVWWENGSLQYSVIGGGQAIGICGSGLIDAVAAALDQDLINERGRVLTEDRKIHLTESIYLTQEDIRQVQLAKGAIAAGIERMADHLGVQISDIRHVYLAGAFGSYLRPTSACRMGLLPAQLEDRIEAVGNAAGSGAMLLALRSADLQKAQQLCGQITALELASLPMFALCFATQMRFMGTEAYWTQKALTLGFTIAQTLDVTTLQPRADVRGMCSDDRCGAYGKNWTCPPYCGSLEDCHRQISGYRRGILLQTVGQLSKTIDTKAYRRTEAQHLAQFHALAQQIQKVYPHALYLGSGGCRICRQCAYPESCRFPQQAYASMEGYGLFVTQVCRDNGCQYHYGEKTITYTACILF